MERADFDRGYAALQAAGIAPNDWIGYGVIDVSEQERDPSLPLLFLGALSEQVEGRSRLANMIANARLPPTVTAPDLVELLALAEAVAANGLAFLARVGQEIAEASANGAPAEPPPGV